MHRHLHKATGNMMNPGNMTLPKEHSLYPLTDPEEMEIQELSDNEFKRIVLRCSATREYRKTI